MPNDAMPTTSGGSGGGSPAPSAPAPSSTPSATPPGGQTAPTPSSPTTSYGLFPSRAASSSPAPAPPANIPGIAPIDASQNTIPGIAPELNALAPTPTDPNSYDSFINKYGGQERLQMAADFFEKFAADDFNPETVLDHMHEVSPNRYAALAQTVIGDYLPKIQQHVISQIAQDDNTKLAALEALGWNAQDYESYRAYVNSGQQVKPVDPEMKRISDENRAIKEDRARQLQAEAHQQRTTQYQDFRTNFASPVNEFIGKMNLPQTKEGTLMTSIIKGAVDHMIEQAGLANPSQPSTLNHINTAYQHFMNGEANMGSQYANTIKAGITEQAKEVTTYLGNLLYKASLYDQMQGNPALKPKEPLAVAQATAGSPGAQPQQQQQKQNIPNVGGYGRFDPDRIRAKVESRLGIKSEY